MCILQQHMVIGSLQAIYTAYMYIILVMFLYQDLKLIVFYFSKGIRC